MEMLDRKIERNGFDEYDDDGDKAIQRVTHITIFQPFILISYIIRNVRRNFWPEIQIFKCTCKIFVVDTFL